MVYRKPEGILLSQLSSVVKRRIRGARRLYRTSSPSAPAKRTSK